MGYFGGDGGERVPGRGSLVAPPALRRHVDAFLQALKFSHSKMVAFCAMGSSENARKPRCGFREVSGLRPGVAVAAGAHLFLPMPFWL